MKTSTSTSTNCSSCFELNSATGVSTLLCSTCMANAADVAQATEQSSVNTFNDLLVTKSEIIERAESEIAEDQKIYMFTWSPDPNEIPDVSFQEQHDLQHDLLVDFFSYTLTGCACVESTQMGNPHYHGFYQIRPETELKRIVIVKVMQKYGNLKIAQIKNSYRINSYTKRNNALYYYKKEMASNMLEIEHTPITKDSAKLNVNTNEYATFFKLSSRSSVYEKLARVNKFTSAAEFYTKSIN